MRIRHALLGIGSGIVAGYAVLRTIQAVREWRTPSPLLQQNAAAYAGIRRKLQVAETARATIGFLTFAYGPLARTLDRATVAAPVWLRPALFFTPLSLAAAVADLPASFVTEYTLERRFGLSEQNRRDWLGEYAKSSLLSAALRRISRNAPRCGGASRTAALAVACGPRHASALHRE